MKGRILIVDDEATIRRALERFLQTLDYEVTSVENASNAIQAITGSPFDVALVDLVMPNIDGVQLVAEIKKLSPSTIPIVMTAFGTISSAVEAMKSGAYHYLTKPFELEDIASLIGTAIEHKRLKEENRILRDQVVNRYSFTNMVGESDAVKSVFDLIHKIADTDSTVLILGESGTGKEMVARAIHYNSRRTDGPMVTVNCGAIPEELLESELFGHVKGAYTGAVSTQPGRFDAANTGTIFLDEIGEMSPRLQVKLLRVLQERRFEPVGSTKSHEVDVRILAATNQDLEVMVKEGRFREDLYYRLNVIPVRIPPLRERGGDVPILINHFLAKYNQENHHNVQGFSKEVMACLEAHPWPGNVRELENLVERLVVLKSQGTIELSDLPPDLRSDEPRPMQSATMLVMPNIPEAGVSFKKMVDQYENDLIMQALQMTGWNKNRAATLLKLNRTTLVEKIKKKKLDQLIPEENKGTA